MKDKLERVLVAREAEIDAASQEYTRIDDVLQTRQQTLLELRRQEQTLRERIEQTRTTTRLAALRVGDLEAARCSGGFVKKLNEELVALDVQIRTAEADVARAATRVRAAHEELVERRIEKKQVEHLLANNRQQTRSAQVAREEQTQDDLRHDRHSHSDRKRTRW